MSARSAMPATWPIDAAALGGLCLLALLPLQAAYGGASFWVAAAGGVVVGAGIAIAGARWRWGTITIALVTVLAYFAIGGAVAMHGRTLFGVIPTPATLAELALAAVRVWKQTLTLATPLSEFEGMSIAPLIAGLIGATAAVSIGIRLRAFGWALVPMAALLTFSIAFSTHDAALPALTGAAIGAIVLLWVAWRTRRRQAPSALVGSAHRSTRRAAVWGSAVVAVAALAAGSASTAAASAFDRDVLREHVVPPLEMHDYSSPLVSFRRYVSDPDTVLFTVDGLPTGSAIRLAALDLYDGIVYQTSGSGGAAGTFTRVGRQITGSPLAGVATAEDQVAPLGVTIEALRGPWMPTAGTLTTLALETGASSDDLHYNVAASTAVTTVGVGAGDRYLFDARLATTPAEQELARVGIAAVSLPTPRGVPDQVSQAVRDIVAGAATPLEQLRAIESHLRDDGFFSHGLEGEAPSRPGHTSERIATLLDAAQMVGDDEQYAVAMALMARQLGIPARVVMGFAPEGADGVSTIAVTGADVRAWVEVPFTGVGWVAFDPTPPEDQKPQQEVPEPERKPQVRVAQPPDPPVEAVELPPAPSAEELGVSERPADLGWLWSALQIGAAALILLVVLLGPSLVLAIVRAHRRRHRLRAAASTERIGGGWAELVDSAVDVGAGPTAGATRRETAAALSATWPSLPIAALAERADRATFSALEPSDAEAQAYWDDVATVVKRIDRAAPWHRRLRARLFPASLLRRRKAATDREN